MADNSNHKVCLGIPVPLSVQALPRAPPPSFHHDGDLRALQALKDFGNEFNVPNDEIDQACNLASGPADIVAVDELIRFATKGARSIHTVTVLDAFSFKPDDRSKIPDERCHELLAEILRTKKPEVVIRCHKDKYKDSWMKRLETRSTEYEYHHLSQTGFSDSESHTIILQSFHPSVAVNYFADRPEYRCLLIYHFLAAFGTLSGVFQIDQDYEEIRQLCAKKGHIGSLWRQYQSFRNRDGQKLADWEAPVYLTDALNRRWGSLQEEYPIFIEDEPEFKQHRTQGKRLSTMYDRLEYLAGQSYTLGAFGIAEAVLFLWKEHFKTNPLYEQVTTLLFLRGSEQQGWFPTAGSKLPIEEELSKLRIDYSKVPRCIMEALDSPKIFEVNKQAIKCVSAALSRLEGRGEVDISAACNKIAVFIEAQDSVINTYLRTLPLTQLHHALKIQRLAAQYSILSQIINCEEYCVMPKEEKCENLSLLLDYLRQLISD